MARSNGQNGPPAAPHWQGDNAAYQQGHAPQHPGHPHPAGTYPQQPTFAPSPDLPPFAQAPQPQLATYAPLPRTQPHAAAPAYAQGPQHAHPPQGWPQPDQNGYDLGQFGHGQSGHVQSGHGQPAPLAPPTLPWTQTGAPALTDPHFPSPASFAEPVPTQRGAGYPAVVAGAAAGIAAHQMAHPGYPAQAAQAGYVQQLPDPNALSPQPEAYEEEYEDEDFEDEEPQRGRKLMVVGALVGAICVGAGLAYAYRAFSGGKTPLIAQKEAPQKTAQAPKPPVKLPDAVPTQAVAAATAPDDGVRRVTSIVIPPPGSQVAAAPSTPAPPQAAPVMPGMILDGPGRPVIPVAPPPAPPAPPLRPSAAAPPAPAPVPPPAKVAVVNPTPVPAPPPQSAPAPERKAAPVAKAKVDDALRPGAPAAPPAPQTAPAPAAKSALGATGGSNGFVATVLSTPKGRTEAMKAFADLQQKFPDVLGAKPAEVQEKDLGTKGVWFRAVVGPPGSRAAAADVCTQLKASGYTQCFVTAY